MGQKTHYHENVSSPPLGVEMQRNHNKSLIRLFVCICERGKLILKSVWKCEEPGTVKSNVERNKLEDLHYLL